MRAILLLALLTVCSGLPSREEPLQYPGILLCSPTEDAPVANCQFRDSLTGAFSDCGTGELKSVTLIGDTPQIVPCLMFNKGVELSGFDFGSIVTFNSTMNVKWVHLFDQDHSKYLEKVDSYSELIYMYEDAGLISITGKTAASPVLYASTLHTHHYGVAPQDIWIRFDVTYRLVQ